MAAKVSIYSHQRNSSGYLLPTLPTSIFSSRNSPIHSASFSLGITQSRSSNFHIHCYTAKYLLSCSLISSPTLTSSFSPISTISSRSLSLGTSDLGFSGFRSHSFHTTFPVTTSSRRSRRDSTSFAAFMLRDNSVISDVLATGITSLISLMCLRFWAEIAKRGIFEQKTIRKLVHISIGLVYMLCWPLFSSGNRGSVLASLAPSVNIIRVLFLGLGIYKDEGTVKSMTRYGDPRELLKGPLFYALSITTACLVFWRTSPVSIAIVCNLCAGDGMADIIGRRFGKDKLPYNGSKSIAGSVAMAIAGFLASVGYMYYFASFGYIVESQKMIIGFLIVSIASAFVESLPISTELDDNLTVTLTSMLVGSLVL